MSSPANVPSKRYSILHENDNVGVALEDLRPGDTLFIKGKIVLLKESVDFGHKFALKDILPGESMIKYGQTIGRATKKISEGEHVHVHNIESLRGKRN